MPLTGENPRGNLSGFIAYFIYYFHGLLVQELKPTLGALKGWDLRHLSTTFGVPRGQIPF